MTDANSAVLTGRLTANPEVRKTQNGLSVAAFTLAVNRKKDETAFINCVAWRQSADYLGQYARKGDLIFIIGYINTRSYERDGKKVYVTEVIAEKAGVLARKQNDPQVIPEQNAPQMAQNVRSQPSMIPSYSAPIDIGADDLPF